MHLRIHLLIAIAGASSLLPLFPAASVHATEFILNGGFESGFTGWTEAHTPSPFSLATTYAGTTSPNGYSIPGPRTGALSLLFDPSGAGGEVLFQNFTAPAGGPGTLSFSMFVANRSGSFINGAPNFGATVPGQTNQMLRVDILNPAANVFSTQPGDIYATFYQSMPGDILITPYIDYSFDLSAVYAAHPGETLRLRFGFAVTEFYQQIGIDNVSANDVLFVSSVPEPGTWLAGLGAVGAVLQLWRRRK